MSAAFSRQNSHRTQPSITGRSDRSDFGELLVIHSVLAGGFSELKLTESDETLQPLQSLITFNQFQFTQQFHNRRNLGGRDPPLRDYWLSIAERCRALPSVAEHFALAGSVGLKGLQSCSF